MNVNGLTCGYPVLFNKIAYRMPRLYQKVPEIKSD